MVVSQVKISSKHKKIMNHQTGIVFITQKPGGRVPHYGVRRECAQVLGSFWPENYGIRINFYWKISMVRVYFHLEFSGIGVYCIL